MIGREGHSSCSVIPVSVRLGRSGEGGGETRNMITVPVRGR